MQSDCIIVDDIAVPQSSVLADAARAAMGLAAVGVQEGDCVALLLRNDAAFFAAQQAAQRLGAYVVPLNWHLHPDELRVIVEDCVPRLLVAHADLLAAVWPSLRSDLPVTAVLTLLNTRRAFGLSAAACVPPHCAAARPDWLASHAPSTALPKLPRVSMIYTSGITGRPKGVRREPMSPGQAPAYRSRLAQVFGVRPRTRAFVGGPLYHSSPNAFGRHALPEGDLIALQSRFDPEALLARIEREGITHMVMVPTMFIRLLKLPAEVRSKHDVSSLEWVTHTAAPCPVEVKRVLIDWWGPVIVETYSGTEVGSAVACTSGEWLARPGTVGRAIAGTRMRVLDADLRDCAPGELGEIYLRCPEFPDFSYHNMPNQRRAVEHDGLMSCGDVGSLDSEGYLYLCDRRRDMVISAGVNIYPSEIENVLVQCPGVRDCAVFSVPDPEFGELREAHCEGREKAI